MLSLVSQARSAAARQIPKAVGAAERVWPARLRYHEVAGARAPQSAATPTNRRWETAGSYRLQTKRWILRPRDVLSMILVSVLSSELCSSVSKQAQLLD